MLLCVAGPQIEELNAKVQELQSRQWEDTNCRTELDLLKGRCAPPLPACQPEPPLALLVPTLYCQTSDPAKPPRNKDTTGLTGKCRRVSPCSAALAYLRLGHA